MTPDPLLWTALGALLFSCLAAVGSRALRGFSRTELHEVCDQNDNDDRFADILQRHERVSLGVDMLGAFATAVFVVCAAYRGVGSLSIGPEVAPVNWRPVVGVGVIAGLILALVRVGVPWSLTRLYAEPFLYHTWPLWRLLGMVVEPLRWTIDLIDALLHRLAGREPENLDEEKFEEEIRTIVSEGHRGGLIEEDARVMIEGVIELGDADVSQIMTPRTDMHMLQADLGWDALLADVIEAGHTRIPVFEKSRDELIGVLYVKDLLPELARADDAARQSIRDLVRTPIFVPETKAVDDLLTMFQQECTHIAIVLDEYGGVAGLVTIEDVLEEIVGEIVDEYDQDEEEEIRPLGDSACEAIGKAHVDEVNELLDLELPEDQDYDTIGGFVFSELGRVPIAGEQVLWNDAVRITVIQATGRRIERVRVERLDAETEEIAYDDC